MSTGQRGATLAAGVLVVLASGLLVGACSDDATETTTSPAATTSTAAGPANTSALATSPVPDPTDCPGLAVRIVDELQAYVDAFPASVSPGQARAGREVPNLPALATDLQPLAAQLGCGRDVMAPLVATELERLVAVGALQQAVADTLRSDPLGTVDPSDPDPQVRTVSSADELVAAVAQVGSGSTIEVAAGTLQLDEPLVALRPVTLRGAGVEATELRSTAAGAALVLAGDGDVTVESMSVTHAGDEPASGLVVTAGGFRLRDLAVRGGRAADDGTGGFGIVLTPTDAGLVQDGSAAEVTDVVVADHQGGGMVIGTTAAPTVRGFTATGRGDDAGCGICWIGAGSGTVHHPLVEGWAVGLRIDEDASPTIRRGHVADNAAGVALTGGGVAVLRDVTLATNGTGLDVSGASPARGVGLDVRGSTDVGVRLAGTARPRLVGLRVRGATGAGLAVVEDASPSIDDAVIISGGEVAAIWGDQASGAATRMRVAGARIGLQVGDASAPRLRDVEAVDVADAAVLVTGRARGSLEGLTCDDGPAGVVVVVEGATFDVVDPGPCEVVVQPAEDTDEQ